MSREKAQTEGSEWRGFLAYHPVICKVFFILKSATDLNVILYQARENIFDKLSLFSTR